MSCGSTLDEIDWSFILCQMQTPEGQSLPVYPGDLKTALLQYAGLGDHPKGEELYQLSREIARLTTCCDPEITYWFSRLISLIDL